MRTEFWHARANELAGTISAHRAAGTEVSVVELSLWDDDSIKELAHAVRLRYVQASNPAASANVAAFTDLVGTPKFDDLYGDIPRRPLFLQMLLSDIAQNGIHKKGRVKLMHDWVADKIARDWQNPEHISPGGSHRPTFGSYEESIDTTVELAWKTMDVAAGLTLVATPDDAGPSLTYDLLPDLTWDSLVENLSWLAHRPDLAAVCTQTLLVPTGSHQSGRPQRLTFAHRAFQEFLAARYAIANFHVHPEALPVPVREWFDRMRADRYP
jgi:hypothetical protein